MKAAPKTHHQSAQRATVRMSLSPSHSPISNTNPPRVDFMKSRMLSAAAALLLLVPGAQPSLAVPQTSACATSICDGQDFSNRDLRKEFYTKGSLKGADFSGSNLSSVPLFGANLENALFVGADLSLADLGQVNLQGANLTQAILSGAIMSSARFDNATIIEGADFTDVIIRKDINASLCKHAKGTNSKTGVLTSESLNCGY